MGRQRGGPSVRCQRARPTCWGRVVFLGLGADNGVDLARIVIICCAADARTARIHLIGPKVALVTDPGSDQWWQVVGTVVPDSATEDNEFIPEMRVVTVERTTPPENTYSY